MCVANLDGSDLIEFYKLRVSTKESLQYLEYVDCTSAILLVKRRKINLICAYMASENTLDAMITMSEVQIIVKNLQAASAITFPTLATSHMTDSNHGVPKIYTDSLSDFSGKAVDSNEWSWKAGDTTNQMTYKDLLDNLVVDRDAVHEGRSNNYLL